MPKDPFAQWEGAHSYEYFNRYGITPDAPTQHIDEAWFSMAQKNPDLINQDEFWHRLHTIETRLQIDFFIYSPPMVELLKEEME
jgi:hypothetical protein